MSWLKKAGQIVLSVVGVATGLMPLIDPFIAKLAPKAEPVVATGVSDLAKIGNVIVTAEQMFTAASGPDAKTGADKLKAATPFVAGIIQNADFLAGKHIKDETKFIGAVTQITSAFADLLNSVE